MQSAGSLSKLSDVTLQNIIHTMPTERLKGYGFASDFISNVDKEWLLNL